jgi:hypothetical protein
MGLVSERVKYDTYIDRCQVYLQLFYKFLTIAPHDPRPPRARIILQRIDIPD